MMRTFSPFYWLLPVLLCLSTSLSAQKPDSISKGRKDSLLNAELQETLQSLRLADSLHREDSLKLVELTDALGSLQTTDNIKKQELLKKLRAIQVNDSVQRVQRKERIQNLKTTSRGFPIVPFADSIFSVYTSTHELRIDERASKIEREIRQLESFHGFELDSIKIEKSFNGKATILTYNWKGDKHTLVSVSDDDALWLQQPVQEIAEEYRLDIIKAIRHYRTVHSFENTLIRIAMIVLILIGVLILIWLINRFFSWISGRLLLRKGTWFRGIKIRNYQLLDPDSQINFINYVLGWFRILIILLALYLALPIALDVFPQTRGYAHVLFTGIANPIKDILRSIKDYIPNLLTILVIIGFIRYTVKFFGFLAKEVAIGVLKIPGFYPDWAQPTFNVVRFLLYAFMFVLIFPYLPGSDSAIFQGVSVFIGILFSLGSSSAISNVVAGLVITYMRPFKIGDRIKIGDIIGDVMERGMLVTRLRTITNENITVPNSNVLSGHTINYSASAEDRGLILQTTITLGYDVPWKNAHDALLEAAHATTGLIQAIDKQPFVWQTSLDDYYVAYQLSVYTDAPENMFTIYSDLHQNIQDKMNEAGIEILSPHYRAVRDGNVLTVPPDYVPDDYEMPGFKIMNHVQKPKTSSSKENGLPEQ